MFIRDPSKLRQTVLNPDATHNNLWRSMDESWKCESVRHCKTGSPGSNICTLLVSIVLAWSKAHNKNVTDGVSSECISGLCHDVSVSQGRIAFYIQWCGVRPGNAARATTVRAQQNSHMCLNTGSTWLFTGSVWWRNAVYVCIWSLMTTFPDFWVFNNRQTFQR